MLHPNPRSNNMFSPYLDQREPPSPPEDRRTRHCAADPDPMLLDSSAPWALYGEPEDGVGLILVGNVMVYGDINISNVIVGLDFLGHRGCACV